MTPEPVDYITITPSPEMRAAVLAAAGLPDLLGEVCRYSLAHASAGVPAVTSLDCGPVGTVPACQACADFYGRMS